MNTPHVRPLTPGEALALLDKQTNTTRSQMKPMLELSYEEYMKFQEIMVHFFQAAEYNSDMERRHLMNLFGLAEGYAYVANRIIYGPKATTGNDGMAARLAMSEYCLQISAYAAGVQMWAKQFSKLDKLIVPTAFVVDRQLGPALLNANWANMRRQLLDGHERRNNTEGDELS